MTCYESGAMRWRVLQVIVAKKLAKINVMFKQWSKEELGPENERRDELSLKLQRLDQLEGEGGLSAEDVDHIQRIRLEIANLTL